MKKIFVLLFVSSLLLAGCTSLNEAVTNGKTKPAEIGQPPTTQQEPAKVPAANKLDLSGQGLDKIPEYVFRQTDLQELDLSGNKLTGALPGEIRFLQNLRILRASNNLMTGVPAEIGQLQDLEVLDLSGNQLTGLPYELGNLKNLKTFNLSGNQYSEYDLSIIRQSLPATVNVIK
ncbi:MAG: leucine-rich repeat domain-containing protein [Planctomycetes bacterium]|jgi:Leucine-rich repeat (LRR) protein|nr:leucine-rich repeat domain-containing protein [Planctomycetota bacterium]